MALGVHVPSDCLPPRGATSPFQPPPPLGGGSGGDGDGGRAGLDLGNPLVNGLLLSELAAALAMAKPNAERL